MVQKNDEYLIEGNGFQTQIKLWLLEDDYRLKALLIAEQLKLNDWMLAAGFVRNLVWDKLHNIQTELNDIDFIYFDPNDISASRDSEIEAELNRVAPIYPWSVKNQARMHLRNQHQQYASSLDAMSYWPEKQTAVGVSCQLAAFSTSVDSIESAGLALHSPFDLSCLFDLSLQHNPKAKQALFEQRLRLKGWLQSYPKLRDNDQC
ncbi:nucleotidyltransferase family protein [uncultured Shewanella sp.]|uniref:nucleotidyltransferase family protein n=1 Tax=uncultured Shewanella sp. TaxID=173975 RepID=UPI002628F230|nr:nucleotidyltransferase family protein [uncultured Shewanella sp.]